MIRDMWPRGLGRLSFWGKKEKLAIDTIVKEAKLVSDTVAALEGVTAAIEKRDWDEVEAASEEVSRLEEKVDLMHREGMVLISEGAFFAGIREDVLRLMEQLDDVADFSKDASRVIAQYPISHETYELVFSEVKPVALVKKAEDAMAILINAVQSLFSDPREAIRLAIDIERREEEGDEIKARMIRKIFLERQRLDVLTLLELKDFVLWLDNVLDAVEHCSDVVIIISAKSGV